MYAELAPRRKRCSATVHTSAPKKPRRCAVARSSEWMDSSQTVPSEGTHSPLTTPITRPVVAAATYGNAASSLLIRSPNAVPNVACFFKSPRYGSTNGPVLSKMSRSPQPIKPKSRINSFVAEPIGTM
jgi:hypothetical protein